MFAVGLCWLIVAAPAQAKVDRITGGQQTVSPSSATAKLVVFLLKAGADLGDLSASVHFA